MALGDNPCIPFMEPGQTLTAQASAAVTGKRLVNISGNRTTDGNYLVAHATAAGRCIGVASYDAAVGEKVGVLAEGILPVVTGGIIAAGAEVEVGTAGVAVTRATGIPVGVCLDGAASGADARVRLYASGSIV